jgi:hypothetical protein
METEYLTSGKAVENPGVSRVAVTLIVQKGRVPAIRIGRGWAIPRDALLAFASTYQKGPGGRKPKDSPGGGK